MVEIGPGLGTLTRALARQAGRVLAMELDRDLENLLAETLAGLDNVEVRYQDALAVDWRQLLAVEFAAGPWREVKVVANLPFYLTTPIITRLLEGELPLTRLVVMVQREVAERFLALPGSKAYGAITVLVRYFTETTPVTRVPPTAFYPPPNVESTVLAMEVRSRPPVDTPWREMSPVIRGAFGQRRKTLANALAAAMGRTRSEIEAALRLAGVDPRRRGETLSLGEFAAVTGALKTDCAGSPSHGPDGGPQ